MFTYNCPPTGQYADYSKKFLGCFKGYLWEAIAVVDVAIARVVARRRRRSSLLLSVAVALSMCTRSQRSAESAIAVMRFCGTGERWRSTSP